MRRILWVLGAVLICGAAACADDDEPTPGGTGGQAGAGGSGGHAGASDGGLDGTAGAAGEDAAAGAAGGVQEQCGEVDEPGLSEQGATSLPSCRDLTGSKLLSVIHREDTNCDGVLERCSRMDELVLPSGVMVPYARYDQCSCELAAKASVECNRPGSFVSTRWDLDLDDVADKDCSLQVYDEQGRMTYERIDRHCTGTPDKCSYFEYDSMGRPQAFPCTSSPDHCMVYRDESAWRPAEWGKDVGCDGRVDEGCVRGSFFFPGLQITDDDCNGVPESGCEQILYDDNGCPKSAESAPACDGVLAGCKVIFTRSEDCSWISVGEDADCNGVPDGFACSYLDKRGPLADAPLDQDCDGAMDAGCKLRRLRLDMNIFLEAADDDCDGKADSHCELWSWAPVR